VCVKFSKLVMVRVQWFIQVTRAASLCLIGNDHPLRPDLPFGRAPRAAAVKDAAATAAAPAEPARSVLCVGHVRQFGGESPLCNLMEVKH